jgi:hypothetical protein
MSTDTPKQTKVAGNELAGVLFDACAVLAAVRHQVRAIEHDEVRTVSSEAHDAGRALRQAQGVVYQLAAMLASCHVTVPQSVQPELQQLLAREGDAE